MFKKNKKEKKPIFLVYFILCLFLSFSKVFSPSFPFEGSLSEGLKLLPQNCKGEKFRTIVPLPSQKNFWIRNQLLYCFLEDAF